jgi:hypothetical protein
VKLSVSVMAHPDRAPLVEKLVTALDPTHTLSIPVAMDDEGPPSGNTDRGWRTARRGWELADPAADFHLLLQDDALPCADLLAGLSKALEHVPPDAVVSAYLGNGGGIGPYWGAIATEANRRRASWVRSGKLNWGVAIILPTRLIPEMIEHANRSTGVPDDIRVCGWVGKRHGEVWYTWPSLVDHLDVPSLTKHRAKDRRAWRHHLGSALGLRWDGPVALDPAFARLRGPRSGPSSNRKVTSPITEPSAGKVGTSA